MANLPRGSVTYWVHPFDDDATEPFSIALKHSRERDVLEALMRAGATGCNFYDVPAPRWASSVHKLRRKRGVEIATLMEPHGGEHPGKHARYVLLSTVTRAAEGGDT